MKRLVKTLWRRCNFRWQDCINTIFPGVCQLCSGLANGLLCVDCFAELLHRPQASCAICDLALANQRESPQPGACAECLQQRPSYHHAISGLIYASPADHLIRQFKDHCSLQWTQTLCHPLLQRIQDRYQADEDHLPDTLVPLPLHWRRRLARGYNQSEIIATELGRMLDIKVNCFLTKNLATAKQHSLNRRQRSKNLLGSLSCDERVHGQHVALIDDVMTTGSSAECAAQTLLTAGARRVDVWVLARTPKPDDF